MTWAEAKAEKNATLMMVKTMQDSLFMQFLPLLLNRAIIPEDKREPSKL